MIECNLMLLYTSFSLSLMIFLGCISKNGIPKTKNINMLRLSQTLAKCPLENYSFIICSILLKHVIYMRNCKACHCN